MGPLTLRGNGWYAYNSEGVMDHYSKRAWREQHWTVYLYYFVINNIILPKHACYYVYTDIFQRCLAKTYFAWRCCIRVEADIYCLFVVRITRRQTEHLICSSLAMNSTNVEQAWSFVPCTKKNSVPFFQLTDRFHWVNAIFYLTIIIGYIKLSRHICSSDIIF